MKDKIINALRGVIDPEIGLDIVSLGLIYGVFIEGKNVTVQMSLSTRSCPLHELIVGWVRDAAQSAALECAVNVELVFEPEWCVEMIDEQTRAQL